MLLKEYRVILPMTVDEYQVAQLYSVAQVSKNETGGGEGVEVLRNEPFTADSGVQPDTLLLGGKYTRGQFTIKKYHLTSKLPRYVRPFLPPEIEEHAWNAFPYCRTVYFIPSPKYKRDDYFITIETMHFADNGNEENVHELSAEDLEKREVVVVDIANDPVSRADYNPQEDPKLYKSEKTGRGLLSEDWQSSVTPVMCCYKLVRCEFKWWGLQTIVEKIIQKSERRLFTNFHRQVFCWTDQWYGLTMADIRAIEDRTKEELVVLRQEREVRGTRDEDE